MKELNIIQTRLVAPKGQTNRFGGYSYRSLEDICEAVRPLLKETGCTLTFSDEMLYLEGRFYVKSTATLKNQSGESESAVAFAREDESRKGMSAEQLSGSASSYCRKYAACSLLCISGADDADAMDNSGEGEKKETKPRARKTEAPAPVQTPAPAQPVLTDEEMFKKRVAWAKMQVLRGVGKEGIKAKIMEKESEEYADRIIAAL